MIHRYRLFTLSCNLMLYFDPLPQILVYILRFLHTSDRKEASLVSRSWYYASQDLSFQVIASHHDFEVLHWL